jgi:hypothetical protein
MRRNIFFLFLYVQCFLGYSQYENSTDDNYYSFFHWKIKDSLNRTITKNSYFFAAGLGSIRVRDMRGLSGILNFSYAYKSLVVSITKCGGSGAFFYPEEKDWIKSDYSAFLIGTGCRTESIFVSLSSGLALTNLRFEQLHNGLPPSLSYSHNYYSNFISFPVELRANFLAWNFIGGAINISKDFIPKSINSPIYICCSIVFGYWNYRGFSSQD